jgi:hypothetical protein
VPAIQFDIPKPDGSSRKIMAFAIPDSALANVIHRKATRRNLNLFSRLSYAYRPDQNVFDAILNLSRSLDAPKSYIIQYDFSKYFDTIDHSYIRRLLFERQTFLLPEAERNAIGAFLEHEYAHITAYTNNVFDVRQEGVPQGSSLSLFLSNAAAHELDLALEKLNGTFVRCVRAVLHENAILILGARRFRLRNPLKPKSVPTAGHQTNLMDGMHLPETVWPVLAEASAKPGALECALRSDRLLIGRRGQPMGDEGVAAAEERIVQSLSPLRDEH